MTVALLAVSTQRAIGIVVFALVLLGSVIWLLINMRQVRPEVGAEVELAPNRAPAWDDEGLEGPRLDRYLTAALIMLIVVGVGLPLYWLAEPGRQSGAIEGFDRTFVSRGEGLFQANCAACHGADASGSTTGHVLTEPDGSFVAEVTWTAPALNNVLLRYDRSEVQFVLDHGRAFSPMQPWSTVGGGAMNAQQISNIIDYLESITITQEEARRAVADGVDKMIADGLAVSEGEALFNLTTASGSYSCARCHTPEWSYGEAGPSGSGWLGPSLVGVSNRFVDDDQYRGFVSEGCETGKTYGKGGLCDGGGQMPSFLLIYTPEQIAAVIAYEQTLDGTQCFDIEVGTTTCTGDEGLGPSAGLGAN